MNYFNYAGESYHETNNLNVEINQAIETIKNNPKKYPEFSFFFNVPNQQSWMKWARKAVSIYNELLPPDDRTILFKMITICIERKIKDEWLKAGKNDFGSKEFNRAVFSKVKELHPEFFKK